MKQLFYTLLLFMSTGAYAQQQDSLRMDSILHQLPEVMVRGSRPIARVSGSTITYDLPRLIDKKAIDNIYDAVKEIPGVTEQDGKISLGGIATTVILDGKVTTMTTEQLVSLLKSLPASRIERAEVMYTAPARMQVRGAVIDIRLKHTTSDNMPLQGEVNLAWNQQHDAQFGERATLLYSKGKFSMDMMYHHSHGDTFSTTDETSRHSLDDGTVHDIDTHEIHRSGGYGHTYRIGMDYNFAQNHRLSLVYQGDYHQTHNALDISGNVSGNTWIDAHTWLHNVRLDYQTPFGLKAGAEMTYYHNPEWQNLSSVLPTGALNYTVDNDQRINRWKFFLSQEHQLQRGWGINYGVIYTGSTNHSSQDYLVSVTTTGSAPESSYTRQVEKDVNVYFGFTKNFSEKFTMEASLAGEYYHTPVWHQWYLYPTLNLTYLPSAGHVFQLNFSSDRQYPGYWAMTNFTTYSNGGYNEITGNPELRPSSEYQLQLVYVLKGKYQFVSWYSYDDDYFTQTPYQRHDRLTVSYKNLNFNNQQQAGLQASLPQQFGKWLNSRLTLIGLWQHERADHFYDIPFSRQIVYGMASLNNTVTLSSRPDITLSVDGMIRSKAIQAIYDLPSSSYLNLSARWQFLRKHAVLRVFCNDLFRTSVINPRIDYKGQNLTMDFSCYRMAGVSFTYKFGGYQEKKREAVDTSRFKQ